MEDIKYVNLIEIFVVVIEILLVENSKLTILINNELVHHTVFFATDTQPCVLIMVSSYLTSVKISPVYQDMATPLLVQ